MEVETVSIRKSTTSGNGLFCEKDTVPGALIFSIERPLISVLDNHELESTCSNCFARVKSFPGAVTAEWTNTEAVKACAACHVLYYCSKVR